MGVEHIIHHAFYRGGGNVKPCIVRGVINIGFPIVPDNRAIGEHNVGNVADSLWPQRRNQEAARLGDHLPRLVKVGCERINHIPQPRRCVPHAVGNVNPSLFGLERYRARAVLALGDGVVAAGAGNNFPVNDRVGDIVAQAEADAAARACLDKVVHWAGIERVFAAYKRGQQADVALLGRAERYQIGQAFPRLEVARARNSRRRDSYRQVSAPRVVALRAEHAVNPAVLMLGQAHVVNVGFLRAAVRQDNRIIPEAEAVHAAFALGKERAVSRFC